MVPIKTSFIVPLCHGQCACAHTETYTLRTKVPAVTTSAVNFSVGSVV